MKAPEQRTKTPRHRKTVFSHGIALDILENEQVNGPPIVCPRCVEQEFRMRLKMHERQIAVRCSGCKLVFTINPAWFHAD